MSRVYMYIHIYIRIYCGASLYVPRSKMVHDIGYGRPFHIGNPDTGFVQKWIDDHPPIWENPSPADVQIRSIS